MKDGKPFTGICVEKDQNDSILKQFEFKNGWTVRKLIREKMGSKYATLLDMAYDNLKPVSGYAINIEPDDDIQYIRELIVIKDGIKDNKESYEFFIQKSAVIGTNERDNGDSDYIYDTIDGLRILFTENIESKIDSCLKGLKKGTNHGKGGAEYYLGDATSQQRDSLLDCVKSNLNKFDYWKN
jgi:hypothetical protein